MVSGGLGSQEIQDPPEDVIVAIQELWTGVAEVGESRRSGRYGLSELLLACIGMTQADPEACGYGGMDGFRSAVSFGCQG
jgi:hypothetical protein